jgi:hypothetical protein
MWQRDPSTVVASPCACSLVRECASLWLLPHSCTPHACLTPHSLLLRCSLLAARCLTQPQSLAAHGSESQYQGLSPHSPAVIAAIHRFTERCLFIHKLIAYACFTHSLSRV